MNRVPDSDLLDRDDSLATTKSSTPQVHASIQLPMLDMDRCPIRSWSMSEGTEDRPPWFLRRSDHHRRPPLRIQITYGWVVRISTLPDLR
jgi:hypothetical protein